jgi:hypothetical protein
MAASVLRNNGNGRRDPLVVALERDVANLSSDYKDLRHAVGNLDVKMDSLFRDLSTKIDASSAPNYALMVSVASAGLLFLGMIGGFAYWPISSSLGDIKYAQSELQKNSINRIDHAELKELIEIQLAELQRQLTSVEANLVPRAEHTDRWISTDEREKELQRQITNNQDRLNELVAKH